MKGHIYKLKNSWGFMIDVGKDSNGKRHQKRFSGFKTKKDAEDACAGKIVTLNLNVPSNLKELTLSSYLDMWLNTYKKDSIAYNTYVGYKTNIFKHIIPNIGNLKLCKLQASDIQDMYNKLHKTSSNTSGLLSSQSIYYIHSTLRKALKDAYKQHYITINPIDFVVAPKVQKFQAQFLNAAQLKMLLDEIKNTDIYLPTLLAAGLGLRRGEVLALKYSDINFTDNTISISKNYISMNGSYMIGDVKTNKSNRVLVVSNNIMNVLKERYEFFLLERKIFGDSFNKEGYINTNDRGTIIHCSMWDQELKKHLKKLNLPKIRIHDLRHSNASLMIKQGVSMKVASERLGHSKISTTMDLYTHIDMEQQADAAKKIDACLF